MREMGFAPLTPWIMAALAGILFGYALVSELAKRPFYARADRKRSERSGESAIDGKPAR